MEVLRSQSPATRCLVASGNGKIASTLRKTLSVENLGCALYFLVPACFLSLNSSLLAVSVRYLIAFQKSPFST